MSLRCSCLKQSQHGNNNCTPKQYTYQNGPNFINNHLKELPWKSNLTNTVLTYMCNYKYLFKIKLTYSSSLLAVGKKCCLKTLHYFYTKWQHKHHFHAVTFFLLKKKLLLQSSVMDITLFAFFKLCSL